MFTPHNVIWHMSFVTCGMSRVARHMSSVISKNLFFFWQNAGVSWWRVSYQRGLPRLVYRFNRPVEGENRNSNWYFKKESRIQLWAVLCCKLREKLWNYSFLHTSFLPMHPEYPLKLQPLSQSYEAVANCSSCVAHLNQNYVSWLRIPELYTPGQWRVDHKEEWCTEQLKLTI